MSNLTDSTPPINPFAECAARLAKFEADMALVAVDLLAADAALTKAEQMADAIESRYFPDGEKRNAVRP